MKELKRIKLTDEQCDEARKVIIARDNAAELLGKAIANACRNIADMEHNAWESLRRVAGIAGDNGKDVVVSVDWLTRELVVREKEE